MFLHFGQKHLDKCVFPEISVTKFNFFPKAYFLNPDLEHGKSLMFISRAELCLLASWQALLTGMGAITTIQQLSMPDLCVCLLGSIKKKKNSFPSFSMAPELANVPKVAATSGFDIFVPWPFLC